MAYNYEVKVNTSKEVDLTVDEFKRLSYYGIASLFCNYKAVFYFDEAGDLKMYFHKYKIFDICERNYRFKDIDWFENESAEVFECTIPKDYPVIKTIQKYFSHLIMKNS